MVLFEIFWWEETWENDLNVGKKKVESICWEVLRKSYNFNHRYKWNVQNGTTFVGEQLGLIPKGWYQFLKLFTTHDIQAI